MGKADKYIDFDHLIEIMNSFCDRETYYKERVQKFIEYSKLYGRIPDDIIFTPFCSCFVGSTAYDTRKLVIEKNNITGRGIYMNLYKKFVDKFFAGECKNNSIKKLNYCLLKYFIIFDGEFPFNCLQKNLKDYYENFVKGITISDKIFNFVSRQVTIENKKDLGQFVYCTLTGLYQNQNKQQSVYTYGKYYVDINFLGYKYNITVYDNFDKKEGIIDMLGYDDLSYFKVIFKDYLNEFDYLSMYMKKVERNPKERKDFIKILKSEELPTYTIFAKMPGYFTEDELFDIVQNCDKTFSKQIAAMTGKTKQYTSIVGILKNQNWTNKVLSAIVDKISLPEFTKIIYEDKHRDVSFEKVKKEFMEVKYPDIALPYMLNN